MRTSCDKKFLGGVWYAGTIFTVKNKGSKLFANTYIIYANPFGLTFRANND